MVLNPALYDALQTNFGEVRVADENQHLRWEWDPTKPSGVRIASGGEQYYVCCPCCGDTRFRLAIGHRFLTVLDRIHANRILDYNFKCFNEGCDFREHPKFKSVQEYVERNKDLIGLAVARQRIAGGGIAVSPQGQREHRLPLGFVSLDQLPPDHPACVFVRNKYGFDPTYIGRNYGVGYTGTQDQTYPTAYNRIIFPIFYEGKMVSWQGRSLDSHHPRRWIFPPGFKKVLYNWDSLPKQRDDVVIVAEGIPAAIACGPTATAIFGKELDTYRCQQIVANFRTAVIAIDPETQVPDPMTRRKLKGKWDHKDEGKIFAQELKHRLDNAGLKIPALILPYPADVMQQARRAADERRGFQDGLIPKPEHWLSVPDPADIGIPGMQAILRSLPHSHQSRYLCR